MPELENFELSLHPLGNEIDIKWEFSETLTSTYKIYLFKRSKTEITDEEVIAYATNPVKENVAAGLFVFTSIEYYQKVIKDFEIEDGNEYYYKAIIVNKGDVNDRSHIVAGKIRAELITLEINVVDCKFLVIEGVKKILKSVARQTKANIMVYNDFPLEQNDPAFVSVSRVSGEIAYKFWANISAEYGEQIIRGDIDTDVIQVMWEVKNSPTLRDKLTNVFRGTKPKLLRYLMHKDLGLIDAKITITGDGYDGRIEGQNLVYGSMLVNCLIENQLITKGEPELITDINYEFGFDIEGSNE